MRTSPHRDSGVSLTARQLASPRADDPTESTHPLQSPVSTIPNCFHSQPYSAQEGTTNSATGRGQSIPGLGVQLSRTTVRNQRQVLSP